MSQEAPSSGIWGDPSECYRPVTLPTDRGAVEARYYKLQRGQCAVLFVGGIGGGFDTPAKGLYPKLSRLLVGEGISALQVAFRHPRDLDESVHDVIAGLSFLRGEGITHMGLVGHSFGGAVVIRSAALCDLVETVVTLATQGYGAEAVANLRPGTSILLIHGGADTVLSPRSSAHVYAMSSPPKRLVIHEGAGHGLDEAADEVFDEARTWLLAHLPWR